MVGLKGLYLNGPVIFLRDVGMNCEYRQKVKVSITLETDTKRGQRLEQSGINLKGLPQWISPEGFDG